MSGASNRNPGSGRACWMKNDLTLVAIHRYTHTYVIEHGLPGVVPSMCSIDLLLQKQHSQNSNSTDRERERERFVSILAW